MSFDIDTMKPADENTGFCSHVALVVKKRALSSFRDKRVYVCQFMLPIAFAILSAILRFNWLEDQPKLLLTGKNAFGGNNFIPYNCANTTDFDESFFHR